MKIVEAQKIADRQKYILSEKERCDLSGKMNFCNVCRYSSETNCTLSHEDRVACSACGSAYNKLQKVKSIKK